MTKYDQTPWIVALGGIAGFCTLMAVLIIMTFFNFRKANANKTLKKKTKDGKTGYHDRLSRLATDNK